MIFEQAQLQIQLMDVLYFNDNAIVAKAKDRPFCAISLRVRGNTKFEVGGKILALRDHDLAFIPANVGYLFRSEYDERLVFHFTVQNFVSYDIEVIHDFHYDELYPLFLEAYRIWTKKEPGYYYTANALLHQIFGLIQKWNPQHTESVTQPIGLALRKIEEDYRNPALSVDLLAAAAHMSSASFRKKFRRELGVPPKQYLLDFRMERARTLLNTRYYPITAVSEMTGYRDAKNFATAFKKKYGYPPSAQYTALSEVSRKIKDTAKDDILPPQPDTEDTQIP